MPASGVSWAVLGEAAGLSAAAWTRWPDTSPPSTQLLACIVGGVAMQQWLLQVTSRSW